MSNITSVRYGHATNSSSSHSIVVYRSPERVPEEVSSNGSFDYGWEEFILSTKEEKFKYLLTDQGTYFRDELVKAGKRHGVDVEALEDMKRDIGWVLGIDHESVGTSSPPPGVSFDDWVDIVMDERVVIIGGNDNSNETFISKLANQGKVAIQKITGHGTQVKFDGEAVIFHDPNNGMKFRWAPGGYEKASKPELVDVKITDHCPHGCAFCYQGSTPEGAHADLSTVKSIIDELAKAQVFEIAIGGGEPTTHPDFAEILRYAADKGITPNFTTFSLDWLADDGILTAIAEVSSKRGLGIGVSVISEKDLGKVRAIEDVIYEYTKNRSRVQVIAQTVVGVSPLATTANLVKAAAQDGNSVLLLGYKYTGRGEDFRARIPSVEEVRDLIAEFRDAEVIDHKNEAFIAKLKAKGDPFVKYYEKDRDRVLQSLSVDTAFLDQYGKALDQLSIDPVLRTSPEGAFSMYVDAVEMQAGPSSWHPDQMAPISSAKDIIPMFQGMAPIPVRGDAAELNSPDPQMNM